MQNPSYHIRLVDVPKLTAVQIAELATVMPTFAFVGVLELWRKASGKKKIHLVNPAD